MCVLAATKPYKLMHMGRSLLSKIVLYAGDEPPESTGDSIRILSVLPEQGCMLAVTCRPSVGKLSISNVQLMEDACGNHSMYVCGSLCGVTKKRSNSLVPRLRTVQLYENLQCCGRRMSRSFSHHRKNRF